MRPFRIPHSTLDTRHSPLRRPAAAGVTLVEVVIAIFVLTVGVLGIFSLFPAGYSLGQQAFDRSVASLAARDALARVMAEARKDDLSFPDSPSTSVTTEPLYLYYYNSSTKVRYGVPSQNRTGTVASVSAHSLTCRIRGDVTPSTTDSSRDHWPNLVGYYFVLTSGAASGRAFRIASSSGGTVNFAATGTREVTFRTGTATTGKPVRVGDHFAIIGSLTGSQCFPSSDTKLTTPGEEDNDDFTPFTESANLDLNDLRTWEIATHGTLRPRRDSARPNPPSGPWDYAPWEYSYGCIISATSQDNKNIYRVDVFVYRVFDPTGTIEQQQRPAGHFVNCISRLDDYDNP